MSQYAWNGPDVPNRNQ
jgi:hypothetical protein